MAVKEEQILWLPWGTSDGERLWGRVGAQATGGDPLDPLHPRVQVQHQSGVRMGFRWARGAADCQPGSCHPTPCAQTNASD